MDEDENICMLISMGFQDIDEARNALRMAKNDLNEAVAILTNEAPGYGGGGGGLMGRGLSPSPMIGPTNLSSRGVGSGDVDMRDVSSGTNDNANSGNDAEGNFPVHNLYELEHRVFQDSWSIPYKREESLGRCLMAATRLAQETSRERKQQEMEEDPKPEEEEREEGELVESSSSSSKNPAAGNKTTLPLCRMESDEHCLKFLDRILPEAFRKLLSSNATQRWNAEIQDGIYVMSELFIETVTARMEYDPVPYKMLETLALLFDVKNDWNNKNRDQTSRGRWQEQRDHHQRSSAATSRDPLPNYAEVQNKRKKEDSPSGGSSYSSSSYSSSSSSPYGWLCDLVNMFGDRGGFDSISRYFASSSQADVKGMASLLLPLANCADVLVKETMEPILTPWMTKAFNHVKGVDGDSGVDIKRIQGKEMVALSDLLAAIKLLCHRFWPDHVDACDDLRLEIICRMLKVPQFNSKMNALKEVSRLIEESKTSGSNASLLGRHRGFEGGSSNELVRIKEERIVDWMAENRVLTVALEGNIDQVQYTDRIKAIVEFLGVRLAPEELTRMWNLANDSPNSHVMDNVFNIMAGAASKFSLNQIEHITALIKDKWSKTSGKTERLRERLLVLTGQIGREAKQIKSTQAILRLLWDNAHLPRLPKVLVERALSEQLAMLTEMTLNRDPNRRFYVLQCVDDIKLKTHCALPAIKHLHAICKSLSARSSGIYQKADKQTLRDLNGQHEIVKYLSMSLQHCHKLAVNEAKARHNGHLKADTVIDHRYTHAEYVEGHLDLMKFMLKEGDLFLHWDRCRVLWETMVTNSEAIDYDRDSCFQWFETCLPDLHADTQKDFFNKMMLMWKPSQVSAKSFSCFKAYFECINVIEGNLKKVVATVSTTSTSSTPSSPSYQVENLDNLTGLDYLWQVITECGKEEIADQAIDYLLNVSFNKVNKAKLKNRLESAKLHKKFISNCYSRLESIFTAPPGGGGGRGDGTQPPPSTLEKQQALNEGCELETSIGFESSSSEMDFENPETRTLTAISVLKASSLPNNSRGQRLLKIRRLLLIAERYVGSIEKAHPPHTRKIPPHAASFHGYPVKIRVVNETTKKEEMTIDTHTNESVGSVKKKIAESCSLKKPVDQISLCLGEVALDGGKDSCLVGSVFPAAAAAPKDAAAADAAAAATASAAAAGGGNNSCSEVEQTWLLKSNDLMSTSSSLSSSTALVAYDDTVARNSAAPATSSSTVTPKSPGGSGDGCSNEELEKCLPGVVMASGGQVFGMLYQLASLDDSKTMQQVRRLVHLIPTDPSVLEALDSVSYHAETAAAASSAASATGASPKLSPRTKKMALHPADADLSEAKSQLSKLFDANAEDMSPFRVLYNLEVLSGRLMPTRSTGGSADSAVQFSHDFLASDGLRHILSVFERDSLPLDTDYDIRQRIYLIALQIAAYLLCGQAVVAVGKGAGGGGGFTGSLVTPNPIHASPIMKPTPPKKSALDAESFGKSPIAVSASKIVQTMQDIEFADTVSCLIRVIWAAAAGNLRLASSSSLGGAAAAGSDLHQQQQQQQPQASRFFASRRSRDSSTGSSGGSTGSDGTTASSSKTTATTTTTESLHAGVCGQQKVVSSGDSRVAGQAFDLLVTCLQLRNNNMSYFYNLPVIQDFIIETLLLSPSEEVRRSACDQLMRLSRIRITNRSLDLSDAASPPLSAAAVNKAVTPRQFLTRVILKTPVPLWMPSCLARGISHVILGQSSEYFELRCHLLRGMSLFQQETLGESAAQMMEDEYNFLNNFTPCGRRAADCTLIAGHLKLAEALATCDGVDKVSAGKMLISEILNVHLFPSSRLIADGALNNNGAGAAVDSATGKQQMTAGANPKCDTPDSRVAAYNLLVELAKDCPENTQVLAHNLIQLHHQTNNNSILMQDFEFEPPIERRGQSNYVGLKNAGATCYMNSVLQQLYVTPGINDQVLGVEFPEETETETDENPSSGSDDKEAENSSSSSSSKTSSVFYQLQNLFGHLLESKLKYYVPEKFWRCFRLFGQPVNVREQQDAFEFFTQIVDQVDEYLARNKKPKIFSKKFEGIFSDQKICQDGCPHRYEREQPFLALNLTVKSNNLQESLDQFVKGELLDGDNAYFCEKCQEKRNTVKRMCIRKLPQTLVIQLKRFHYDWETNRAVKFDDYFQFPWTLEMGPYTSEGIRRAEQANAAAEQAAEEAAAAGGGGGEEDDIVTKSGRKLVTPAAGSGSTPRKLSFSKTLAGGDQDAAAAAAGSSHPYELVGVVVHSGQANAGHYYSYIKERRGNLMTNRNKNKWFKFNDTTVEEFEMTDDSLMKECFGGTYKVKKTTGNSDLPEDRQRYWNAYMLFYEALPDRDKQRGGAGGVKKSASVSQARLRLAGSGGGAMASIHGVNSSSSASALSSVMSPPQRKISTPACTSTGGAGLMTSSSQPPMTSPAPRESLTQLSDLLEKGEQSLFFASRMPSTIEREIQEENLQFLQNRDVYSEDYYRFIFQLCQVNSRTSGGGGGAGGFSSKSIVAASSVAERAERTSLMRRESVRLSVHFLLNSYLHVKKRQRTVMNDMVDNIEGIIEQDASACRWLAQFLAQEGNRYFRPLLLECGHREVRHTASELIERCLKYMPRHAAGSKGLASAPAAASLPPPPEVKEILTSLVALVDKDVAANYKNSNRLFWIISAYAQMGVYQCKQLFELNVFNYLIKFLLGIDPSDQEFASNNGESKQSSNDDDDDRKTTETSTLQAIASLANEESPSSSSSAAANNSNSVKNRQRKWSPMQSRDFGELHSAICHLILSCDTSALRTCDVNELRDMSEEGEASLAANSSSLSSFRSRLRPNKRRPSGGVSGGGAEEEEEEQLIRPIPASVGALLRGGGAAYLYVRECVSACREIGGSQNAKMVRPIVETLTQAAFCSNQFSRTLIEEIMKQYNNVNSGDLKNLSTLLLEMLVLDDPLQQDRLQFIIDGDEGLGIDGLLTLVKNNQNTDSRRSYQCIKTLVNAANKSQAVKERLLRDPDRWQWSVNWLKDKMGSNAQQSGGGSAAADASGGGSYWTFGGNSSTSANMNTSANSPTSSSSTSTTAGGGGGGGTSGGGFRGVSTSTTSEMSNEDGSTRTAFQRTTSAQVILEEANALLAEFGHPPPPPGPPGPSEHHHKLAVVPDQMDTSGGGPNDPDLNRNDDNDDEDGTVPDIS